MFNKIFKIQLFNKPKLIINKIIFKINSKIKKNNFLKMKQIN